MTLNFESMWTGQATAATGMLIVFTALGLIALFIACLPKMLAQLETVFPTPVEPMRRADEALPAAGGTGDTEIVAAIGYVLHLQNRKQ